MDLKYVRTIQKQFITDREEILNKLMELGKKRDEEMEKELKTQGLYPNYTKVIINDIKMTYLGVAYGKIICDTGIGQGYPYKIAEIIEVLPYDGEITKQYLLDSLVGVFIGGTNIEDQVRAYTITEISKAINISNKHLLHWLINNNYCNKDATIDTSLMTSELSIIVNNINSIRGVK